MTGLRPRSMLWQLGLALLAAQAVVALGFGLYARARLVHHHGEQTRVQLERVAGLAASRLEPMLGAADATAIQRVVTELGARSGTRITVILPDGIVAGDSEHDPGTMDNHRYRPEIDLALSAGDGSADRFSQTLDTQMMYVARLVGDEAAPVAVVRAALPLSDVDAQIAGLIRGLAVAGAVSLVLTFGVIYVVSRTTSRTVLRLARGADRFASGHFEHRIVRPTSDELGQIAAAFNRMAGQLEGHIDTLESQRAEQRAILQSMSNAVVALDDEQRVLSVNRAGEKLLNVDGARARGRLLQEVVREPQLHGFVAEAVALRRRLTGELTLGAGRGRIVEATAEPLQHEDEPRGVLIVLNDVTQLRRLETIRSDFAANVSHELRTPITNIQGYIETLLDSSENLSPEGRRYLDIVHRNVERLAAIVEDLLSLARLEEPETRAHLERSDTAIGMLVQGAIAQLRPTAEAKGIVMKIDVPADLHGPLSPRLIEQAIANLVSNAVKYSPSGGTIAISATRRSDGDLEIAVRDEGAGIPAEHLPRLFERFYRVDRARSRELGGTGLGLAIVKHIALVHGGRAEVQSAVGRGSTFRLVLPMAAGIPSRSGYIPR